MASSRFAALLPPSAKRFIFWELMEMMAISLMAKKALTKIRIKMSTILGHMSIWKKSTSFCNGPGALPVRGARLYGCAPRLHRFLQRLCTQASIRVIITKCGGVRQGGPLPGLRRFGAGRALPRAQACFARHFLLFSLQGG